MKHFSCSRLLLLFGTLTTVLVGCGSSTEPAEPLIHTPGSGSFFIFTNYATDSTGDKVNGTEDQSTRTVIATNSTVAGQTGVVQFLESSDTISMKYEANGDVQLYQPPTSFPNGDFPAPAGVPIPTIKVPGRWVMFGLGSKEQKTVPGFDTTVTLSIPGVPIPLSVMLKGTGATTYVGTEDLMVAGETIATQKALLKVDVTFTTLLGGGSFNTVDTLWFAPKLGMFIKDVASTSAVIPDQLGGGGGPQGGSVNFMTAYTLK